MSVAVTSSAVPILTSISILLVAPHTAPHTMLVVMRSIVNIDSNTIEWYRCCSEYDIDVIGVGWVGV